MSMESFKCDKCGSLVERVAQCQSFVCTNQQCRKHFWHKGSERIACKHCGYEKSFKCNCGGEFYWQQYCGAYVCGKCGLHKSGEKGQTFAQCSICGWNCRQGSAEDDIGTSSFDGESWNVEY